MHHELKIWPQYYERVKNGSKTFEIRINDRGFQAGDTVELRNWLPNIEKFSHDPILRFKIGYVFPIDAERVAFSLLPMGDK